MRFSFDFVSNFETLFDWYACFSQNEKDLEKRYELLSEKLRELMLINDFNKTSEQKSVESILLNELLNNVMERNELVLQLDEENKLYEAIVLNLKNFHLCITYSCLLYS